MEAVASYTESVAPAPWRSQDQWARTRTPSPRSRRQPSPRAWRGPGRQRGGGKGSGKGSGKGKDGVYGHSDAPNPESLPQAPKVPALPAAPIAAPASSEPPAESEDSKILDALVLHLKDKDTLPGNLKELLATRATQSHRQESKLLHGLVKERTRARTGLSKVRAEMAAFEQAWASYSDKLLTLLQEQLKQRQETIEKLQKSEATWVAALADASQALEKATQNSSGSMPVVSATEDMEAEDDEVAINVATDTAWKGAQEQAIQQLMVTLSAIQKQQPRREGSRTPRRGVAKDGGMVDSSHSPELKPAATKPPPGDA